MKHIAKQLSYTVVSMLAVFGLTVLPASAMESGDHTTGFNSAVDVNTNTQQTDNTPMTSTSIGARTGANASTDTEPTDSRLSDIRTKAQQELQTERTNIKQKTEVVRQKACEDRQKDIDARTTSFANEAQRHLDVFNGVYTKVQTFYANKKLNVSNYDTLTADATAKQTAAQAAVTALKSLNIQIDCTQPDPASSVATIKQAVANARTALQNYRTSLVNLITALKGASTAQASTSATTTTTGGTK